MARVIETYRGFVYPWTIDHVGHMNVASYTARFDEASWHFLAHLGLTPTYFHENSRALVALDQRTRYELEVLAGSLLDVSTELVEIGRKTLRFKHLMRSSESGAPVANMDLLVVMIDTKLRKSVALPSFVSERAKALV
jgi:acyl-CoA thioester hydrolase